MFGRPASDYLSLCQAFASGYDSFFSFCRKRPVSRQSHARHCHCSRQPCIACGSNPTRFIHFVPLFVVCPTFAVQGYSGVATFTRIGSACPVAAEEGVTGTWPNQSVGGPSSPSGSHPSAAPIGHNSAVLSCLSAAELRELDSEGRCVLTDHGAFLLFNCYIPNAGESRNDFKLRYLELLSLRIRQCQAEGRQVVVVGDINIAATRLDHCAPEPFELDDGSRVPFEESPSRQWWRSHVADTSEAAAAEAVATAAAGQQQQQQSRLVDVLRCEFPTQRKAYTCWNTKTGARAGNYGSRIDYILASSAVASATHSSRILAHVQGSDHCPVQCEVDVQRLDGWRVGSVPPALCSQWWPELSGQQKKLSSFFTKRDSSTTAEQQPVDSEEVVTLRASAAGPSNTAVSMKSAPLTTQPKRPISETVSKSGQKKRKPSHADTAPSAVANATLLSYFPAAAKPTPAKSAAASASAAADIDTAFQTDRLDGIQQHLTPNATVNHSSAPPAVLNPKADVDSSHSSDRCADRVEIDQPADVAMAPPASNPARRSSAPASPPAPNSSATSTPLFSPPPPAPLAADSFARLFTQSSLSVLCDHSLPARM